MAEIKKINTELQLESALRDGNGSPGTNGQVLSSTGTATDWISLSEIQGVDGTGTANYISKWSDTDTITNSIIFDNGTNVGIGTASPSQKLDVAGSINLTGNVFSDQGFYGNRLWNSDNTALRFATNNAERMRISSSGNVGIGTTSPGAKLDVEGRVDFSNDLRLRGTDSSADQGVVRFYVDSSNKLFIDTANNGSNLFVIDSSGNIGIGTTSPSTKLEVISAANEEGIAIKDTSGNLKYKVRQFGGNTYSSFWNSSNTEQVRINSGGASYFNGGNVGIGTTSPSLKLQVVSSSIVIADFNTTSTKGGIKISEADEGGYLSTEANRICLGSDIGVSNNNLSYHMGTNSLGIGTGNPTTPLHIKHDAPSIRLEDNTSSDNHYLTGNNGEFRVQSTGYITIRPGNTVSTRFDANGNVGIGTTSPAYKLDIRNSGNLFYGQTDLTNTTSIFRIRANGGSSEVIEIQADGKVGIGTTSPTARLDILTNSATGDSDIDKFIRFRADNGEQRFSFKVGQSGNAANLGIYDGDEVQKVKIDTNGHTYFNGGNVGIGNTAPTHKIHIEGTNDDILRLTRTGVRSYSQYVNSTGSFVIRDLSGTPADRLAINSSGNVGIGTSSPSEKLEVNGNISIPSDAFLKTSNNNFNYIELYNGSNASMFFRMGHPSVGRFGFLNNSDTEVFTIDARNEKVGIGTTSPLAKLHVKDANTLTSALANTSALIEGFNQSILQIASHSTGYSQIAFGDQDDGFDGGFIYNNASRYLAFEAANAERMRVTSTGNVGIGTTSPSVELDVNGTSKVDTGITEGIHYVGTALEHWGDGGTGLSFPYNDALTLKTASSDRLHINSNGNVGIGTTSPQALLNIESTTAPTLRISNGGGTSPSPKLEFYRQPGVSSYIQYDVANKILATDNAHASGVINYKINGSEKMRISSNGNVGIGTTSPSAKLEVNGGEIRTTRENVPANYLSISTTSAGSFIKNAGGTSKGLTIDNISATSPYINFKLLSNEAARITSDGNVGIGTTAPSKKLEVNGQAKFYEHSGAHLTNQATSNFNFDTLANNAASYTGGSVGAFIKLTGTPPGATGIWSTFRARAYGENAKGNTDGMITFFSEYRNYTSTNAVTLGYHAGLYVKPLGVGGLASVTNNYGVYLNPGTAATNNYGVYQNGSSVKNFFQGKVSIGTTTPNYPLTVVSETGNIGVAFFDSADNWERIYIGSTNDYIERKGSEQRITFAAQGSAGQFTFQTSGSEKLRITNSGNVGIGTTSPGEKLHVFGGAAAIEIDSTTNEASLKYDNSTTTANIKLANNDLKTELGGVERMRILSNGNVGIGTTSPSELLTIAAEGPTLRFEDISSSNYTDMYVNNFDTYLNTNGRFFIQNQGSTKLTVKSDGNVGIGTTSPSVKLDVAGDIISRDTYPTIYVNHSGTTLGGIRADATTKLEFKTLTTAPISFQVNSSQKMLITNSGNVGIGTNSPAYKLDVNGTLHSSNITLADGIYHEGDTNTYINFLSDQIQMATAGSVRAYINSSGRVGLGTTSPSERLHLSGEPHPSIRLSSSSDSNYNVVINCGYRNEALNLSVGGYKVFTTEGYNTPETTHLYSNNSKALSLASNQAATFTSTVTATNFINSSDERLKENIEKVCNNSLDVQWKTFEFKSDRGQKRYGVIAQELEKTNPEFVREDAEGFKSVAYIDLLIAKIAELEERIQTLENK